MGNAIDEVRLSTVEIDLLDAQPEVKNDANNDANEDGGTCREEDPVESCPFAVGVGAGDIEQNPANGKRDQQHDHDDRDSDRPAKGSAFEHQRFL